MDTKTTTRATKALENKRNDAAQRFFTAQIKLLQTTEVLVDNVHAITQDPARRASLDALIGAIADKQLELATLLETFLPPRSEEQADYDKKFVRAGHKAENRLCDHVHYSFDIHGRFCTCGTSMNDPGD